MNCEPNSLLAPMRLDLQIYRGDDGEFIARVVDEDAVAVDISAATWLGQIRETQDASTVVAELTVAPGAETNEALVQISAAASGALTKNGYWDLQMTLAGKTRTLFYGLVKLMKDVSRPVI